MKKPKVSILMTAYNHQMYIKSSIDSILSQTFKNFEFIIIDNGSKDNSRKIIKNYKDKRIKFYSFKKNIGRTKCLNFGLKKCVGKYIAIQDSDDLSKRKRIQTQLDFMEKNLDFGLIGSNYNLIDSNKKIIEKKIVNSEFEENPNKILFKNTIAHSTTMFRNEIQKKIGGYPKQYLYAQDYAFYLKVVKKYKIKLLSKILVDIRVNHINSETHRLKRSTSIQLEEIKLIFWIIKNINLNIKEKFQIFFKLIIVIIKIFRSLIN